MQIADVPGLADSSTVWRRSLLRVAHQCGDALCSVLQRMDIGGYGIDAGDHQLLDGELPPGTCFLLDAMPKLLSELEVCIWPHSNMLVDSRHLQTTTSCLQTVGYCARPVPSEARK